jgi:hypothetical protein
VGISYEAAEQSKSDIYRTFLPAVNSGRVELLDHRVLRTQLEGLERRTARGGRDSIDHPPGGKDDVANAAAGALIVAMDGFELRPAEPEDEAPLNAWAPEVLAHEAREQRRIKRHRPDPGPIPDAVW